MRDSFASEITALAAADERICFLVGDIGFRLWDKFQERFPTRFYNCGIAEQGMISTAAGLALAGYRPVVYAIASFATTRCLEQIRVDLCYHNLPVVIVGVGAGLSYSALGPTHHACEDIAMLRCLPNLTIVAPCDPVETRLALRECLKLKGPSYLRLGKAGESVLWDSEEYFRIGNFRLLGFTGKLLDESGVCLLACGPIASLAMAIQQLLAGGNITSCVVSAHTAKPLDEGFLKHAFSEWLYVTIEEHSLCGGLGSAVAEWLVDNRQKTPLLRFGTPDVFPGCVGNREQALAACGLTAEAITAKILESL